MERDEFSEKGGDTEVPNGNGNGKDNSNNNNKQSEEEIRKQQEHLKKEAKIRDACKRRDIQELQALAQSSGGFLTDELRQQAWPILLGLPLSMKGKERAHDAPEDGLWKLLPPHRDEEQVKLDVARAFVYYPNDQSEHDLNLKKTALENLILSVLRRYPYLHYFQGYHDIAQVFLLVLPPTLQTPAVARLSLLRIRDFMLPNFNAAIAQLRLLPSILRAADPRLWYHLSQTEPFFALSGTLTMYAHDVTSLGEITRLFDILLAREPVFSVYMFAAIVMGRRAELFDTPATEPEMLHSILSKLPKPLDLEAIISRTSKLFHEYPPEILGQVWDQGISEHSVLKTARITPLCAGQSEAVGSYYFEQQVLELQRQERREKLMKMLYQYRKPARTVGFAVLFGVLAYWMRRTMVASSSSSGSGTSTITTAFLAPVAALFSKWWSIEI